MYFNLKFLAEIGKKIGDKLNMLTKFFLYTIIFILLIILLLQKCGNDRNIKQIQKIAEQNYEAIQDSFKMIKKTDKEIVYVDRTPVLPPTRKSPIFESNININSEQTKKDSIKIELNIEKNDSGIYILNDIIISDTLPNLSYKISLMRLDGLNFKREFNYKYNANLKIELNKDKKGYFTKVTSNDTNLNLSGNSIYYQKSKKEIRREKLKRAGIYIGAAIIFSSGVYLGTKL